MDEAAVITLHNRMTDAEFDAEWQRHCGAYGDGSQSAMAGKRDQDRALIFSRSNWTQEEIAAKVGISQSRISRHLKFGQFLTFMRDSIKAENLPTNLTETRFSGFWKETDKADNDRKRFLAVAAAITAGAGKLPGMPAGTDIKLGRKVIDAFGDGKWHDVQAVADHFPDETPERIDGLLDRLKRLGTFGAKCEERKHGRSMQVRIFPGASRTITVSELREKLSPLIKELKVQGRANMATMSPASVFIIAGQLEKLLDELGQ